MTVATNQALETIYGEVKRHEACLAKVERSAFRVERDIFGSLLAESRAIGHDLENVMIERNMSPDQIDIPSANQTVTPHSLIDQRNKIRDSYAAAIADFTTQSSVRDCLESHLTRFSGSGQDKLEILCAAVVSDQ